MQALRPLPNTSQSLLHRAFTEVPDYGVASRGFLGGVTPLESLQGLPSYEEAETQRSFSETDLAARFAAAGANIGPRTASLQGLALSRLRQESSGSELASQDSASSSSASVNTSG